MTIMLDGMERVLDDASGLETDRTLYLALAVMGQRYQAVSDAPRKDAGAELLTPFELRVFSQNGEDGVLAEILARVGTAGRFFVEFGVESGREGNCVSLADVFGWAGLFIECDDGPYSQLQRKYRANDAVHTLKATVTPDNVEELFALGGVPLEPDVLSIDVDGNDYWIWEAISQHRPRVMVIEYNSALDPASRLVQLYRPSRGASGARGQFRLPADSVR